MGYLTSLGVQTMSSCHVGSLSVGWKNDSIWGSLVLLKRVSNPGLLYRKWLFVACRGPAFTLLDFIQGISRVGFSPTTVGLLPRGTSHQRLWDFGHIYLLVLNSQFRLVFSLCLVPLVPLVPLVWVRSWVPGTIWMKSPFAGSVRQP